MSEVNLKAVIPVAGLGTRMLPATKALPKEMLPLVDKPLIQYVVDEAVAAGIREIVLVTHSSKNSIENHFDTSFELEATLEKRVKRQLLEEVKSICPKDVTIVHVRQGEAMGLGHAIACAYPVIGNEPFVVMLPDVIIDELSCNFKHENLAQLVARYKATGHSQILVKEVAQGCIDQFGVVDIAGCSLKSNQSANVVSLIEKPSRNEAPSTFAVVGRYVFSADMWPILAATRKDTSDEVQLTDAIESLCVTQSIDAFHMAGEFYHCGTKLGYMTANLCYALRRPDIGPHIKERIKTLVAS